MAYPQRSSWGSFTNPEYTRLQNQIQQETLALLRQRDNLSNNPVNKLIVQEPYLKPVESQKYIKLNTDRSSNNAPNPRNVLSDKVRQLVDLCKGQNSEFGNQLIKVLGQQRNIYNDLVNSNGPSSQKTQYFGVGNPIMEAQKESSVIHGSRQQHMSNLSSGNQSSNKINFPPKSNIRQAIENNPKVQAGDELIQMIEQIERKALNEIEKLRQEKIDLMKQLKQQIQSNNELQKQINNLSIQSRGQNQNQNQRQNNNMTPYKQFQFDDQGQSQKQLQQEILKQIRIQMDNLRQQNDNLRVLSANKSQQVNGSYSSNPNQVAGLKQRIQILEGQLRNRDELIKALSVEVNRLNQKGGSSSNYQLSHLLQQGESIRQNTIHLIRMKQGQPNQQGFEKGSFSESERIRELQELLQREEEEKQNFLNDLLVFKQKYQQLEEENRVLKRQSKFGSSDLAKFSPIYDKSNAQIGASIDDYEKLLSQMRGVNRF